MIACTKISKNQIDLHSCAHQNFENETINSTVRRPQTCPRFQASSSSFVRGSQGSSPTPQTQRSPAPNPTQSSHPIDGDQSPHMRLLCHSQSRRQRRVAIYARRIQKAKRETEIEPKPTKPKKKPPQAATRTQQPSQDPPETSHGRAPFSPATFKSPARTKSSSTNRSSLIAQHLKFRIPL